MGGLLPPLRLLLLFSLLRLPLGTTTFGAIILSLLLNAPGATEDEDEDEEDDEEDEEGEAEDREELGDDTA